MIRLIPQERISDHIVEQTVDIPSLQIQDQTDEVMKVISKGRVQQHTEEQITADADKLGVLTQVFEGQCERTKDNDLLRKFRLKDIPSAPCGASPCGIDVGEGLNVSAQNTSTGRSNRIATTNEKGRWSQTVSDRMIQEAERCQVEDETNKAKVEAKKGMEKYCVATKNTVTEEKLNLKFEARDKERTEKTVQDARNWLGAKSHQGIKRCVASFTDRGSLQGFASRARATARAKGCSSSSSCEENR